MMAAQRSSMAVSWRLSELLSGFTDVEPRDDREIVGLALDSRAVHAGSAFFALPGTQVDGLRFAAEAAASGAAAVLYPRGAQLPAELPARLQRHGTALVAVADLAQRTGEIISRFYGDPSERLRVVAITGTDGKTSVSHLLGQVLDMDGGCALLGTLGQGRVNALQPFGLTTPPSIDLQRALHGFVQQGIRYVSLEASSHALDQYRLAGTRIEVAVLTNLGRDHLDYHDDQRAYARAKAKLFDSPGLGTAVLNVEDEFGRTLAGEIAERVQIIRYATRPSADVGAPALVATAVDPSARGLAVELDGDFGKAHIQAPLLGEFNAANLVAAAASLLALGWSLPGAAAALSAVQPIPGRMQRIETALPCDLVVDYAHTPQALERALLALRPLCTGRLWCVFGCGGDRDQGKRPLMGQLAERIADRLIVTDDNPRTEDPALITDQVLAGLREPAAATVIHDRRAAIRAAMCAAGAGDLVLIAGKGHETRQYRDGGWVEHDDRVAVSELAGELT